METAELLKKVRRIEIKTRGLSNHVFAGQYHSAFKGKGMAFSEVREYQPGDDVRSIDWNVTARFSHPFVKVYEEERELTVILMADLSGSSDFGTHKMLKRELITELCAVLAFSAIRNNDKIGAIFFTGKVEKFIPPKKGKSHILRIIRELLNFEPEEKRTNIQHALEFLNNMLKKRAVVFLLSDFLDSDFEDGLRIANRRHDLVALRISDQAETGIPKSGLMPVVDAETGETMLVDFASESIRRSYKRQKFLESEKVSKTFSRLGIDSVQLSTGRDYVPQLMNMFKQRG